MDIAIWQNIAPLLGLGGVAEAVAAEIRTKGV
jgi:hypothetical protein